MAACTRKLRQERGASVVFALVIFLIVTIFSWTMVNGALTAAQNASMQSKEEQAYLNVTSAARLFCQEADFMVQDEFNDIPVDLFPSDWRDVFKYTDVYSRFRGTTTTPPDRNLVQQTFIEMQDDVDQRTSAGAKKVTATKTLYMYAQKDASDNGFEGFGTVQVKLTMTKTIVQNDVSYVQNDVSYSVEALFQNVNPDAPRNAQSNVSVTFKGMEELASRTPVVRKMQWSVSGTERGRYPTS